MFHAYFFLIRRICCWYVLHLHNMKWAKWGSLLKIGEFMHDYDLATTIQYAAVFFILKIRSIFNWTLFSYFLSYKNRQKIHNQNIIQLPKTSTCWESLVQIVNIHRKNSLFPIFTKFQKCLDKDPAKRWSCERLMSHPLFEDYLLKHREDSMEHSDSHKSNRSRDKSKVFEIFVSYFAFFFALELHELYLTLS